MESRLHETINFNNNLKLPRHLLISHHILLDLTDAPSILSKS